MSIATPRDAEWPYGSAGRASRDTALPAQAARARQADYRAAFVHLTAAVASQASAAHVVNEDCHSPLDGAHALFVVADGVGGGVLASTASRDLVAHLHAALAERTADAASVRAALLGADRAIALRIAEHGAGCGAATVAVCVRAEGSMTRWLIAWVGDCRVYRVSAGADDAEPLTVDDTYRHLDETPPCGGSPDDPARMIGNGAVDAPNVREVDLRAGECFLLCSDGVHRHVTAQEIARVLCSTDSLAQRCARLVELARLRGSRDDATGLAVQRTGPRAVRRAGRVAAGVAAAFAAAAALWLATDRSDAQRAPAEPTSLPSGAER
jgi:protein phosphatase